MRRERITITIKKNLLEQIDKIIDGEKIRNRSSAIEYLLNKYFSPKITQAVILAGGKGTKLRPYTLEIPKSLLLIKGKPILEYIILALKKIGIKEVIIATGYKGEKIKEYFGNGEKWGIKIIYSHEEKPLQTGGALLKAKPLIENKTFLLIHGDIVTNLDFADLINFHKQNKALATVALTTVENPEIYGQLQLHGVRLVNFYQKNKKISAKTHLVNCGIYVLEPEIFNYFPKDTLSFYFEDVLEKLIKKSKVTGFVFESQWFDVGTSENYEKAIREFNPS